MIKLKKEAYWNVVSKVCPTVRSYQVHQQSVIAPAGKLHRDYTVKKCNDFPVPSRLGTGKSITFFYSVCYSDMVFWPIQFLLVWIEDI
jgi:hypothetical protein